MDEKDIEISQLKAELKKYRRQDIANYVIYSLMLVAMACMVLKFMGVNL